LTDDQKRAAISAEVARGDEALAEAEILLVANRLAGAVSRAYYGAYHYARGLLLTLGEEPRSHGGLTRLLQREFSAAMAKQAVEDSRTFIAQARSILAEGGWLDPEPAP
jgi:uncharacterized protein (UPF0332 family)